MNKKQNLLFIMQKHNDKVSVIKEFLRLQDRCASPMEYNYFFVINKKRFYANIEENDGWYIINIMLGEKMFNYNIGGWTINISHSMSKKDFAEDLLTIKKKFKDSLHEIEYSLNKT